MKKILLVSLSKAYGGIERLFYNLFGKPSGEYKIDIITFHDKCAYQEEFEKAGHKIINLPSRKKNFFKFNKIVKEYLSNHSDYDYIWVNTASTSMYQFQLYGKKLTDAKIITHSHGTSSEKNGKLSYLVNAVLSKINYKKVVENTDIYLGCSKKAGIALFGEKYEDKIIVLNNLINVNAFSYNEDKRRDCRSSLEISEKNKVIALIGRISPQKNIPFAIEIFKDYAVLDKETILVVVGEGELLDLAKKLVDDYDLNDRVRFVGRVDNVADYYSAADALIIPSIFEGFPLTCIEAQAGGLPCILADTITDETKITDLVKFLPINQGTACWINELLDINKIEDRAKYKNQIIEAKYDFNEAEKLLKEILK